MAKLIKRAAGSGLTPKPVVKTIQVEDKNGNKQILKATVFSVSSPVKKDMSAELVDERLEQMGLSSKIVPPPLSQAHLASIQEISSELGQTIDAMVIGIEGFGGRAILRKMDDGTYEKNKTKIEEEQQWLQSFIESVNAEGSLTKLRKHTRKDLEQTGNAYWELIRPAGSTAGRLASINKLDVSTMYISKMDRVFTKMEVPYVTDTLEVKKRVFQVRFRRYVQIVGDKRVWFKAFGDPRLIDRRTGELMDESLSAADKKKYAANEVHHHKIYATRRTPYGMPRYTGNIIAIRGSRGADETNIITQQNNHVPSMAISVSGGQLTEGSIKRIQEFVDTQIKSDSNYSKFLLLEADGESNGLGGSSTSKIEIKSLSEAQHKDQLWQEYDKANASKIRRSFRVAPILAGSSEDYDRSTAQVSEALTEKYVYNPEREEMDDILNRMFIAQGIRFWRFKSNSPNVTNDEDLVQILTGAERSGALTPRIARQILSDILNKELEDFDDTDLPKEFDPDVPFSFTLAKLMHEAGKANQNGTMTSQGQTPKAPGKAGRPKEDGDGKGQNNDAPDQKLMDMLDPQVALAKVLASPDLLITALTKLRDQLDVSLDQDAFGGPQKDIFAHGH